MSPSCDSSISDVTSVDMASYQQLVHWYLFDNQQTLVHFWPKRISLLQATQVPTNPHHSLFRSIQNYPSIDGVSDIKGMVVRGVTNIVTSLDNERVGYITLQPQYWY